MEDKYISKLYRYEALLQAVDFFTQKFSQDQIALYALDFANEILTLNSSALFLLDGESFKLRKNRNYHIEQHEIPDSYKLQCIATFLGDVIQSDFYRFFNPGDLDDFNAKLIIPLIIHDKTYGFIVSDGKSIGELDEDDIIIARTLMRLIDNSLENSKIFAELQEKNIQLDQKVFNLFSISQSSRALLSELDLDNIYSLSIDIFSELTSSKVTSFGIYDDIRKKIIVKAYRHIFNSSKYYKEFELRNTSYSSSKMIFHYEKDRAELDKIFMNVHQFSELEAEYIILIVKDKILGFVTISKTVNDRLYDESLFELIESLAISTYISLNNAMHFKEVTHQKQIVEQKLNILVKLNKLIKNINSCEDIDELANLTIRTLNISFGIKKAIFAVKDHDKIIMKDSVGFSTAIESMQISQIWDDISNNGIFFSYIKNSLEDYFETQLISDIGDHNCLVIAPLVVDSHNYFEASKTLGYLIVLQSSESLKEEEILLIDTISNSISPIMDHMLTVLNIKAEYMLNPEQAFLKSLDKYTTNKKCFFIDFFIYYKKIDKKPFTPIDLSAFDILSPISLDGFLFIFSEQKLDDDNLDGFITGGSSSEEIIEKIKML